MNISAERIKYINKLKRMSDNVSIQRIAKLHPKIRSEVPTILAEIQAKGVSIRVTQGLRTFEEQANIYNQGRTLPGKIVSNAKPGSSFHQYGCAVDFCLLHSDGSVSFSMTEDLDKDKLSDWTEVVNVFKSHGWSWGGDWIHSKDTPHFEKTFGHTWQDMLEMVNSKEVDSEGYVLI